MDTYVLTALAGIAATIIMAAVMSFIHSWEFAEADMIHALGGLVTRNEENALFIGAAIHLVSGVIFAFLYVGIWSLFPLEGMLDYLLFGILSGTFHGLVMSFLLIKVVAGRLPLERFQNAGIGLGVANLLDHVAYGVTVGAIAGWYQLRFEFVANIVALPS